MVVPPLSRRDSAAPAAAIARNNRAIVALVVDDVALVVVVVVDKSKGDVAVSVAGRDVVDFDDGSLYPMALCQRANSYAKAGHDDGDEDLFWEISAAAIPMLGRFDSRHCSNLAHAFALAGHALAALFEVITAAAIPRMPTFTSQNMANIWWVYAMANHASPILFDAIAGEATMTPMGVGFLN